MYRIARAKIKEFQRKIGKNVLDKKKIKADLKFENIKKILFIRYDGKIGDYIVSSFIYREIKKQRPDIQIDIVGINKNEQLFNKNKHVDNFYKLKKTKYRYMIPLTLKLRKQKYDILIDPTEVLKNKDLFFIRQIDARVNFGYAKENYKLFNKNIPKNDKHIVDIYKMILEKLGFKNIDSRYDIPEDEKSNEKINRFFTENLVERSIVVNLFGAKRKTKFTCEKSLELLNYVLKRKSDYKIILLYSPADTEILSKILATIDNKNLLFYSESKTIFDSIAILKRAELIISPDTSIVHIADGLNKKIIAFYTSSPNDFIKWKISDQNKIIRVNDVNDVEMNFLD